MSNIKKLYEDYPKKFYEDHRNNKKTGIIFLSILTFWTLSIIILPWLWNPFFAITYFLFITTIGFYFTFFLIFMLYVWASGHFFDNRLRDFLLKNHSFWKICIILLAVIFLIQVSIILAYDANSFSNNMAAGAFGGGDGYIGNGLGSYYNEWHTFGIIPYCLAGLSGTHAYLGIMMTVCILLVIYGAVALYTGRYDVWNYWLEDKQINKNSKEIDDKDPKVGEEDQEKAEETALEEIALEKNAKKFEEKLTEAQERIVDDSSNYNVATSMVVDQIRETIKSKDNLEEKQIVYNEKERLEKLKHEIISKRRQEKQFKKNRTITELQKFALLRDLGEISPTLPSTSKKTIDAEQEKKITNNYELKPDAPISFVETNIDKFSKAVNDDFNHELFEIFKKTANDEDVEIPLIETYADDIFKEADQTLKSSLNMDAKDELSLHKEVTAETIIDPSKHELMTYPIESSEEILEVVNEAKETVKKDFEQKINNKIISENLMNSNKIVNLNWCKKYSKPQLFLLKNFVKPIDEEDALKEETIIRSGQLDEMFAHFKIDANVANYIIGPMITTFEIAVQPTVRLTRIVSLEDNIKLTLGVKKIRIQAPIPGKTLVGIEIPNRTRSIISYKDIFEKSEFKNGEAMVALGKTSFGQPLIFDLFKTPNLLIVGAPNSNKNKIINLIIISLLMHYEPTELKFLLIDSKKSNFNIYREIPHLIAPIITSVQDAHLALKAVITEINNRYDLMTENQTRDISELNKKLSSEEKPVIPYLIVIIDELAELMQSASAFTEEAIAQIVSKARTVGVDLIIGTEKTLSNIITKKIKINIASKIVLALATNVDSKIAFDHVGAEKLLENGDMLLSLYGQFAFRGQAADISFEEINDIVNYVKKECKPFYQIDIKQQIGKKVLYSEINNRSVKGIYQDVYNYTILNKKISIPMIQKRFKIDYNEASKLIDALEWNGVIDVDDGTKIRNVLINSKKND